MSLRWMIVYPCGDRTRLSVNQVRDYEVDEWDVAYDDWWPNTSDGERECREKMVELGERYGLRYSGQRQYLR